MTIFAVVIELIIKCNEGQVASAGDGAGDVPDAAPGAGAGATTRVTELQDAPRQTYRRLN